MHLSFRRAGTVAAVILLASAGSAAAHSYRLGSIRVGHLWAPPAAAHEGVAVYGAILNMGKSEATLAGATSDIGGAVRIRRVDDGAVSFKDAVTLAPGKPLALAKWREHLFVEDNSKAWKGGDHFPMTLDFGSTGKIDVEVIVEEQPSE